MKISTYLSKQVLPKKCFNIKELISGYLELMKEKIDYSFLDLDIIEWYDWFINLFNDLRSMNYPKKKQAILELRSNHCFD